ncbi:MAG: nucleotide exchange factor GrpE [Pseudomonadota bacterium]
MAQEKKSEAEIEAEFEAADAAENPEEGSKPSMPDLDGLLDITDDAILDDPDTGEAELTREQELEAENADLRDKLLRAMAEMENLRKRAERDRRDAEVYGGQRLARDLLSVHDNMERAMDAIDDELKEKAAALVEGIELTQKGLIDAFAKHHIEPLQPQEGDKFDPQVHQAVFEAPVPGVKSGHIIQVMNVGFKIGDRLLRPADVGVAS